MSINCKSIFSFIFVCLTLCGSAAAYDQAEYDKQRKIYSATREFNDAVSGTDIERVKKALIELRFAGVILDDISPNPLLVAAQHGNDKILNFLMENGWNVMTNGTGADLLRSVIDEPGISVQTLKTIIDKGVAVNQTVYTDQSNVRDGYDVKTIRTEFNSIEYACRCIGRTGNYRQEKTLFDKMELLVRSGADPLKYPMVLFQAVQFDRIELVKMLIDKGMDVKNCEVQFSTSKPYSAVSYPETALPLNAAAKLASKEMVELLLSHGSDPSKKDGTGQTALECALQRGDKEIIKLLQNPGKKASKGGFSGTIFFFAVLIIGVIVWFLRFRR